MEGMEARCGWGRDRQVTNTVDPCCLVVQEEESLGWREGIQSSPQGLLTGPSHLFPGVSPLLTGALSVCSCSRRRGRPISLPGAHRFCVLIFQSSDLTAFYCSAPSSQQQKRSHSLSLLDRLLDGEELGATAMTGGPGALLCKALTCAPADGSRVPASTPGHFGLG